MNTKLIDPHNRRINKVRMSLLDSCDLRCLYCMPEESQFLPIKDCLNPKEILDMANKLCVFGIDEFRITGGEPTLRPDLIEILHSLSSLPIKKLALTTNAVRLKKLLPELSKTKCVHLNISLDSLNKKNFALMTRRDCFEKVIESILLAKQMGFHIKLNTVMMKGLNDHEAANFVEFSSEHNIEVRFLELMRIGEANQYFSKHFITASEIQKRLEEKWRFKFIPREFDSTSYNYFLSNGAQIGFIASESRPFCGGCSRLRINAKGEIHPCLMLDHGVSLRNKNLDEMQRLLFDLIKLKPTDRIEKVDRVMNQIGG